MADTRWEWGVRYVSTTPPNEGLQIMGPTSMNTAHRWLKEFGEQLNENGSPANVEVRLIKRQIQIGDWEPTE